jgi:hypothetical protein
MRKSMLLVASLGWACGETAPPAIEVGPVSFTENDLLGLSEARRETLVHLAVLALSVADSSTTALGAPLVDQWTEDRLLDILAADVTLEKHHVGGDVLEAHYLTAPEWELTVRHILFFSERWRSAEHRVEAEAKAGRAMELLLGGADFAETAARLSEEPGAEGRQGLLAPGREGSWVPEFWKAALGLEPGGISPTTETEYGYHILRLDARQIVAFEEGRTVIARKVAASIEDPDAVLEQWLDGIVGADSPDRRSEALAEAERRRLRVPNQELAELARAWNATTYRWASTFDFTHGLTATEVSAVALAALANSRQDANIVRTELAEYSELLSARYAITWATRGN